MVVLLIAVSGVFVMTPVPPVQACSSCNFLLKWGSTGSGNGQLNPPQGVAVDASGNVFVVDSGNNRVEKFTSTGTFILAWGSPGSANGHFSDPYAIAVDASGNVYVTDVSNHRVQKFTSTGTFTLAWGGPGSGPNQFSRPFGVAVDSSGNVYVTDFDNNRVEKFTNTGTFTTQWTGSGPNQLSDPNGIAVDGSGNVYVADYGNNRVEKFTNTGAFITAWGSSGSGDGEFGGARSVAVDSSGSVYVIDDANNRVEKFTNTGIFILTWGSGPGSANGEFNGPQYVAVDSSGNVYVADTGNNRVQLFGDSTSATISLVAGWNLISLPLVPVTTAIKSVLNDLIVAKNLTIVWSFQAGVWKSFTPPSTGTLTTVADGLGYWVKVTSASRLTVLGYVIPPAMAPPSYSLSVGWNLIGFKPQPDPTASENVTSYLQSLGTKYDNNNVWIYNNGPGTWTRAACDYAPTGLPTCAQYLSPGEGLWVNMKTAGTLSP